MSENFLGEVRMFGGNYAPTGWALCNGQLMSIAQNSALYALIGTTYGGDGIQTFALPNMQGRLPISQGAGPGLTPRVMGETGGAESVTLLQTELPAHNHVLTVTAATASVSTPGPTVTPATATSTGRLYTVPAGLPTNPIVFAPQAVLPTGGNASHDNLMPAVCVSFIIALQGIFPSRN